MFMVSLKQHDRKISIPVTLHLVKFSDSGYNAFFFSQLVFKIMMVVSLKMVTNMYQDLRSKRVYEYS